MKLTVNDFLSSKELKKELKTWEVLADDLLNDNNLFYWIIEDLENIGNIYIEDLSLDLLFIQLRDRLLETRPCYIYPVDMFTIFSKNFNQVFPWLKLVEESRDELSNTVETNLRLALNNLYVDLGHNFLRDLRTALESYGE